MYNEGIAVWVWFLSEVLMIALIIVGPIIVFRKLFKRRSSQENATQEQVWDFGDEWKSEEASMDTEEWKEIFTLPEGYSRIYDRAVPILRRETVDLSELQRILSENKITSIVAPSVKTESPASGLFVQKKFVDEAKRILNISA